jgi:hypothetical protein
VGAETAGRGRSDREDGKGSQTLVRYVKRSSPNKKKSKPAVTAHDRTAWSLTMSTRIWPSYLTHVPAGWMVGFVFYYAAGEVLPRPGLRVLWAGMAF